MNRRRWQGLVVLCLSLVIVVMDNTIVNVGLPSISHQLDASAQSLQWLVDSYAVSLACLLLIGGRLGDRWGRRTIWQVGLMLYAATSAWASLSSGIGILIAARVAMGASAALVMPGSLALIATNFSDSKERTKAISIWAASTGIGVILGPVIGGLLLERYWWGSIFLVNVGLAALIAVLGSFCIRESSDPSRRPIDVLTVTLGSLSLGLLVWGIITISTYGWLAWQTDSSFVAAVAAAAGYVTREFRSRSPVLDPRLLRKPEVGVSALTIALAFFGLLGTVFLLTQYLQVIKGYSPLSAGIRIVPFALALAAASGSSPKLVHFAGTTATATLGFAALAGGVLTVTVAGVSTSYWYILPAFVVMGAGVGLSMAPASDRIMRVASHENFGVVSSVNDISREVGGALGVAVIGTVAVDQFAQDGTVRALSLPHVSTTAQSVTEVLRQAHSLRASMTVKSAFVSSMHTALIVGVLVVVGAWSLILAIRGGSTYTALSPVADEQGSR